MLLLHGVRSCLEFAKTGDHARAVKLSNREMSPHLQFLDLGGHGYAAVSAAADALEVEFVCIPRPLERSTTPDGGPLRLPRRASSEAVEGRRDAAVGASAARRNTTAVDLMWVRL